MLTPAASARPVGLTVWLTGLSGAGKTTISRGVHAELVKRGIHSEILDGDEVRKHLSSDLGFSRADRDENVRRIGALAKMLTDQGIVVLVSAMSPFRATRDAVRTKIGAFCEVYVNAPLPVCERRDTRALYQRAHIGELRNVVGIDVSYEPPVAPEIECKTDRESVDESVDKVVTEILRRMAAPAS